MKEAEPGFVYRPAALPARGLAGLPRWLHRACGVGLACLLLAVAPAGVWAENVAVLFSGGVDPLRNHDRYHRQVLRMYGLLTGPLGFSADRVVVVAADGLDPGVDRPDGTSTDYTPMVSAGSPVHAASSANLQQVLAGLDVDQADLLYFWSYDHGDGAAGEEQTVGEEVLSAWGEDIADEQLADWLAQVQAGRSVYVFSQCFAGGMLDNLGIEPGQGRFGAAACEHDEYSYWDYFANAWADGIAAGGHTHTVDVFEWAVAHDPAATEGVGPGPYTYGVEHPWRVGDNLDLAVARWRGAGAGGSMVLWSTGENWSRAPSADRTVMVELDGAGEVLIDAPDSRAGYLTVDSTGSGGRSSLTIAPGGGLISRQQVIGERSTGTVVQRGGRNEVAQRLLLADRPEAEGRYELFGGELAAARVVAGGRGRGRLTQAGGRVSIRHTLSLGERPGSAGTVRLEAGVLSAGGVWVGQLGEGTLVVAGGRLAAPEMVLGRQAGGRGHLALASGSIDVDRLIVGLEGSGQVTWTGGRLSADEVEVGSGGRMESALPWQVGGRVRLAGGGLDLGEAALVLDGPGQGGELEIDGGNLACGRLTADGGGESRIVHRGGSAACDEVILGGQAARAGRYEMVDGVLRADGLQVGRQGRGRFTQTGGTVEIAGQAVLGTFHGANGQYQLAGGRLEARRLRVGFWGAGEFAWTGGQLACPEVGIYSDSRMTVAGDWRPGGPVNVVAGQLNVAGRLEVADRLDLRGGSLTAGELALASTGEVRLSGGRLEVADRLEVAEGGRWIVEEPAELRLASADWTVAGDAPAGWDLRELAVVTAGDCTLELISTDLGEVPLDAADGLWLGALAVGGDEPSALVIRDGHSKADRPAALYVRELTISPGSWIDLLGFALYVPWEGRMRRMVPSDGRLDGRLTADDLALWGHSPTSIAGAGGTTAAVPEPYAMASMVVALGAALRGRRPFTRKSGWPPRKAKDRPRPRR